MPSIFLPLRCKQTSKRNFLFSPSSISFTNFDFPSLVHRSLLTTRSSLSRLKKSGMGNFALTYASYSIAYGCSAQRFKKKDVSLQEKSAKEVLTPKKAADKKMIAAAAAAAISCMRSNRHTCTYIRRVDV